MKARIYDAEKKYLRTETGEYKKAKFNYSTGQIDLKIFKVGGEEKSLACNYKKTYRIDDAKEKTAFYVFDGEDYTQIEPNDLNSVIDLPSNDKSIVNVLDQDTIAEGIEKEMLPKPFDLNTLIPLLLLAIGLAECVVLYFIITHGYNLVTALYKPVNDTLHICEAQTTACFAQDANLSKTLAVCINRIGTSPSVVSGG